MEDQTQGGAMDVLVCGNCRRNFSLSSMQDFIQHKMFDCQGVRQTSTMQCQSCPQKFKTPWTLLQHAQQTHALKIYLEEGPYSNGITDVQIRKDSSAEQLPSSHKVNTRATSPRKMADPTALAVPVVGNSSKTVALQSVSGGNVPIQTLVCCATSKPSLCKCAILTHSMVTTTSNVTTMSIPKSGFQNAVSSSLTLSPSVSMATRGSSIKPTVQATVSVIGPPSIEQATCVAELVAQNLPKLVQGGGPHKISVLPPIKLPHGAMLCTPVSNGNVGKSGAVKRPVVTTPASTIPAGQIKAVQVAASANNKDSSHEKVSNVSVTVKQGIAPSREVAAHRSLHTKGQHVNTVEKDNQPYAAASALTVVDGNIQPPKTSVVPRQTGRLPDTTDSVISPAVIQQSVPEDNKDSSLHMDSEGSMITAEVVSTKPAGAEFAQCVVLPEGSVPMDSAPSEVGATGPEVCACECCKSGKGCERILNLTSEELNSCQCEPYVSSASVSTRSEAQPTIHCSDNAIQVDGADIDGQDRKRKKSKKNSDDEEKGGEKNEGGENSESSALCCDNQDCGVTIMPGTHERLKKCCNAVVPKKRKRHMETKHRVKKRAVEPSYSLPKENTIYIDFEPGSDIPRVSSKSGVTFNQADSLRKIMVNTSAANSQDATQTRDGQTTMTFSIPVSYTRKGVCTLSNCRTVGQECTCGCCPLKVRRSKSARRFSTTSSSDGKKDWKSDQGTNNDDDATSEVKIATNHDTNTDGLVSPTTTGSAVNSNSRNMIKGVSRAGVSKKRRYPTSRPFKCDQCDHAFNQRIHLKKHQSKHTGIKPFKCQHCDYSTVERSHLKVHIRVHTGEKPYKCSHCEYATAQNSTLKIHLKRHHGQSSPEGADDNDTTPDDATTTQDDANTPSSTAATGGELSVTDNADEPADTSMVSSDEEEPGKLVITEL